MQRNYYFDNLKFLLITLVVIGHMIEPLSHDRLMTPLYYWIYSFHMPLFIFIVGFFSKNYKHEQYGRKILTQLIIPYIVFETFLSWFDFYIFDREKLEFTYFTPYWITWFLFSLIIWKVVLPYVAKSKYILLISLALCMLIGYSADAGYYASIERTIVYFPYFIMGFLFDEKYIAWIKRVSIKIVGASILSGMLIFYYYHYAQIKREWLFSSVSYEDLGYDMWYAAIYRLLIVLVAIAMGISIMAIVPRHRLFMISAFGKHTIIVYLTHSFIVKYLTTTPFYHYFNTTFSKLLLILLAVCLSIVLSSSFLNGFMQYMIYPTKIYERAKMHYKQKYTHTSAS